MPEEHRSFVRPKDADEGWVKPDNYAWDQGIDAYVRQDVAGMYTGDGRLKRISCSGCGVTKGYKPSHPCDCSPNAEWQVRTRPLFSVPVESQGGGGGYTALPAGGGTLNRATPRMGLADLKPDERPLTRYIARCDLENEGFTLPAPSPRISKGVARELLTMSWKARS